MVLLLIVGVLWLCFSPFLVMGRTESMEKRLEDRIRALEEKIDAARIGLVPSTSPKVEEMSSAESRSWAPPLVPEASEVLPGPELFSEKMPEPTIESTISPEAASPLDAAPSSAVWEPKMERGPEEAAATAGEFPAEEPAAAITLDPERELRQEIREARYEAPEAVPGPIAAALARLQAWLLTEGNIWVCAGVLLFLAGFGLLFKYAVQTGLLTLEMRLAAAAATGIVMSSAGFRMRERRRAYGLVLQGGGMGVLYLVVLAATKFNSFSTGLPVLSEAPAVAAMVILSVLTVLLALLQNYQPLAVFAILGGFAAPLLLEVGAHSPAALFSVCTLMNLEILLIAFRRRWRLLSRMGFLITLGIGVAWGHRSWTPELFLLVEPFLLAFFLTYTLIVVHTSRKDGEPVPGEKESHADLPLAVLVPLGFFLLQTRAAGHLAHGTALTCLGMGLWYLSFGAWMLRRSEQYHSLAPRLFIALSILFSNLVVPYAFEHVASSAAWAVEGAFLIAAASRCGSFKVLLGGIALQAGALVLYAPELPHLDLTAASRLSPILVSGILFSLAFWTSGFQVTCFRPKTDGPLHDDWERWMQKFLGQERDQLCAVLSWGLTGVGALWWWWTLLDQAPRLGLPWFSAFSASCVTALAGCLASRRLEWRAARILLLGPLSAGLLWSLGVAFPAIGHIPTDPSGIGRNPITNAIVFLATIGPSLRLLRDPETGFRGLELVHFSALFVGLTLAGEAAARWAAPFGPDWARLLSLLPLLATLVHISRANGERSILAGCRESLLTAAGASLFLGLPDFIVSFVRKGGAVRGIFIPLLNPLELWQAGFLLSLSLWLRYLSGRVSRRPGPREWGLCALLFVWVNQMAARAAWWYSDEALTTMRAVLRTAHYQGVLAILWGVLGLAGILYGKRGRSRAMWRAGAALLAVDMIKLLILDLDRAATLTRILAFLVLGGLFLLIGWAAPLPPKEESDERNLEPTEGGGEGAD